MQGALKNPTSAVNVFFYFKMLHFPMCNVLTGLLYDCLNIPVFVFYFYFSFIFGLIMLELLMHSD